MQKLKFESLGSTVQGQENGLSQQNSFISPHTPCPTFFSSVLMQMVSNSQDAYENTPQDEFIQCFKRESIKVSRAPVMYLSYTFAYV